MTRFALYVAGLSFAASLAVAPIAAAAPTTHEQVSNRNPIRSKLNALRGRLSPTKKGRANRKEVRRIRKLQKHVKNQQNPRRGLRKIKRGRPSARAIQKRQAKRRANPGKPIKNLAKRRR